MLTTLAPWLPKERHIPRRPSGWLASTNHLGSWRKPLVAQALGLLAEAVQEFSSGHQGGWVVHMKRWQVRNFTCRCFWSEPQGNHHGWIMFWIHFRLDSIPSQLFPSQLYIESQSYWLLQSYGTGKSGDTILVAGSIPCLLLGSWEKT